MTDQISRPTGKGRIGPFLLGFFRTGFQKRNKSLNRNTKLGYILWLVAFGTGMIMAYV